MTSCLIRRLSHDMHSTSYPAKLLRAVTYDPTSPRKRLLSEHNDCRNEMTPVADDTHCANKRPKQGSLRHDSGRNNNSENHCHMPSVPALDLFENIASCPYSPIERRRATFEHINSASVRQLPTLPASDDMLLCQQSTVIDKTQHDESNGISSIFLTAAQVAAYVTSIDSLPTGKLMIIDCGSPLRHSERHIKDALLLNINDKLSRKRLATRGLKNFLDAKLLHRLEQSDLTVLYDDSTACPPSPCANASSTPKLSPAIKCIFDEIQRFDSTKTVYVLQSTFDEFYTQHPVCCHVNASNVESTDQPLASPTVDLDAFDMCEILPGLYLGNARDAQDRTALANNNIHAIVNISTSIPCFHAHDSLFDYLRLACEDSSRENILQHFEAAFSYMRAQLAANKNVLVHCQGGISRSPSFVIGYLMSQHGQTFNEAYALVRAKRSIVNPNLNFIAQLTRYEQLLSATPRQ